MAASAEARAAHVLPLSPLQLIRTLGEARRTAHGARRGALREKKHADAGEDAAAGLTE